ncbi:toll/interleukin-1 receptor domain-containing protein [Pseudomonas sp.]|uniref:toll/interleukin-1 receptor domain-containing protein n=1 Tax=Pseudomonas sp. TaxID=306 RepID=UPI003D6E6DEE
MTETHSDFRYWAFISYSSRDQRIAKRLHKRLETYRIPRDLIGRPGRDGPVPKTLFPIFRDREELPMSADLGSSIEDALRASRYLIVLCSPSAASSRWVNEEIRYFKSLGRSERILALMLDGEPNASDDPAQVSLECFAPALRFRLDASGQLGNVRTEPIAGDLRKGGDGWKVAFFKAMAGITGLGYDAFARRERRRQKIRRLLGGIAAGLLVGASIWVWDYNRLQVSYYANLGSRWGIPQGVGEIDQNVRRGRETHYQVESRHYKVRRVLRVNSAGHLRDDKDNQNAAVQSIFYREDGAIEKAELRDHNNQLVLQKTFSELEKADQGKVHYIEFRKEQRAMVGLSTNTGAMGFAETTDSSVRSEITVHRVEYDEEGRVASIGYRNANQYPRANGEGIFGQMFLYDNGLLATGIKNLGIDGLAQPNRLGISLVVMERSALGDTLAFRYFDSNDQPAFHQNQYHALVFCLR